MDQHTFSTRDDRDGSPFRVEVPQSYDGIGQALRVAFRDHRAPPDDIAAALGRLDLID